MHVLTLMCFDIDEIVDLFRDAEALRVNRHEVRAGTAGRRPSGCEQKVMATLFFEASTRTRISFEVAMKRLGGSVVSAADATGLSVTKGESLAETVENVGRMVDVVVVRAREPYQQWFGSGRPADLAPVINGGDGPHNHPTQALLDLYTVWRHHGGCPVRHKHVVIGDLGNSRTIRSYVGLMARLPGHEIHLYDSAGREAAVPGAERLPGLAYHATVRDAEREFGDADVVYLNRVQRERHQGAAPSGSSFVLTDDHLGRLKAGAIVLNPGPCQDELPARLHDRMAVKVAEQVENGVYARMALLRKVLGRR